jgi:hypothetical protein
MDKVYKSIDSGCYYVILVIEEESDNSAYTRNDCCLSCGILLRLRLNCYEL